MKRILLLTLILFSTCKTDKPQNSIYGKWTTAHVTDHTGLEISDEIIYYENGNYEGKLLSKNDSIIETFSGKFEFQKNDSVINMKSKEYSFEHKLIEFNQNEMFLRLKDGNIIRMVRKK